MDMQLEKRTWTRLEPLADGEGSYGMVYSVRADDDSPAAAKFVLMDPGAQREALIGDYLKVEDVSNVVPIIDSGEHDGNWVMVMPKADKSLARHLRDRGGQLETEEALSILTDIATALVAIKPRVVHRDLKPENILFLDGKWCIADFGVSRLADADTSTATRKYEFPKPYAAPEQWRHEHATSATDVYAFGIIAYELISGRRPFEGTPEELRQKHLQELPPTLDTGTSRLRQLIEDCLQKRAEARPSAERVLARLQKAGASPSSAGGRRLSAVNQDVARRQAEWQVEETARREAADRRAELFNTAVQTFPSIVNPLIETIEDEAPTANVQQDIESTGTGYTVYLNGAKLEITVPRTAEAWDGPFEVIAVADIVIEAGSRTNLRWRGRSHSLWYCDAKAEAQFAWYETAFMDSPLLNKTALYDPYAMGPQSAMPALQGGMNSVQLAWPFTEIDRDDSSEFLDRLLGWLSDAAEGELTKPRSMPERPTEGSWRR